ncbi:MAG: aryl-alcohol dehydrogenase-like predicted oxidoreductase [Candidatus Pseudothioglobus sp.]
MSHLTPNPAPKSGHKFNTQQWRSLGQTGLLVSPLGLGTVKLGRNTGVKYPQAFDLPDDAQVETLLSTAKDCGINLIDTAPAYGISEQRLGHLLPGPRTDWVICTKVGETFYNQQSRYDFTREATRASLAQSLRLLGTDYLDIVLVHCPDEDLHCLQHTDVLAELARWQQRGHIRAIGASTKTVAAGLFALDVADIAMVTFNPADQSQLPVMAHAQALGKNVLLKKVLASGHLMASAPETAETNPIALALDQPSVASAIIGTTDPGHLKDNVRDAISP